MMREEGSLQQRRYVTAREYGHARADAAEFAGLGLEEARLIDIEKGFVAQRGKVGR